MRFIVSASYRPYTNCWCGFSVEMGKSGTHQRWNIVYNGDCVGEFFKTEKGAKQAARNARNK